VKIEDKVVGEANAAFLLKNTNDSSFITNADYSLYKSTLLDSGTTIHIFNDLSRFQGFKKAPRNHVIRCGNHFARILGYGTVNVEKWEQARHPKVNRIRDSKRQEQPDQELIFGTRVKTRGL